MGWLMKLFYGFIADLMLGAVETVAVQIDNIFQFMYELNINLGFTSLNNYTIRLATACVSLFAVKQGFEVYVLNTGGDSDEDPLELITRMSIAIAVIRCGTYIIEQLIKVASLISVDVVSRSFELEAESTFSSGFSTVVGLITDTSSVSSFVLLLFLCVLLVSFIIFVVQAAKRGAELILFQLMLPLIALDLLTTGKERWNSFFTELMICVFGYIIQMLSFNVFMVIFSKVMGDPTNISYIIASVAWLMVVLSAPKWLQKFLYSSGVGNAGKGGARSAASMIPNLIKK